MEKYLKELERMQVLYIMVVIGLCVFIVTSLVLLSAGNNNVYCLRQNGVEKEVTNVYFGTGYVRYNDNGIVIQTNDTVYITEGECK